MKLRPVPPSRIWRKFVDLNKVVVTNGWFLFEHLEKSLALVGTQWRQCSVRHCRTIRRRRKVFHQTFSSFWKTCRHRRGHVCRSLIDGSARRLNSRLLWLEEMRQWAVLTPCRTIAPDSWVTRPRSWSRSINPNECSWFEDLELDLEVRNGSANRLVDW